MNDNKKIELSKFIDSQFYRMIATHGNMRIPKSVRIEFSDSILNKIKKLKVRK